MHEGTFKMWQGSFHFLIHKYGITLPKDLITKNPKHTTTQPGELICQTGKSLLCAAGKENHTKLGAEAANQMKSTWEIEKSLT